MNISEIMKQSQEAIAGTADTPSPRACGDPLLPQKGRQEQELRECRYCVHEGRNFEGVKGFIATVQCRECGISVNAFASDEKGAKIQAVARWNRVSTVF